MANDVTAQEAKTVGDENLEVREVEVEVNEEDVDAQVVQEREPDASTVAAHETRVALDEVITDPSSPLAVQVPDAGRGNIELQAHRLSGPRPEDVFAAEASEPEEPSDDEEE